MISITHRRLSQATLAQKYPTATILDLTSKGPEPWVRFSPFFPHGGIPIPLSPGHVGASVEGIWQGLKVFDGADIDATTIANTTMKGIKRTVRSNGPVLGHRAGIGSDRLLSYRDARILIYLPCYWWVLQHKLTEEIAALGDLASRGDVVLLDFETNANVENLEKPLSHASLVKHWLEGTWPHSPAS